MDKILSPYFIDNGNGAITDRRNGLSWLRFAIGQEWDGAKCIGEAKLLTHNEALGLKISCAGFDDWRLPTKKEMIHLVFFSEPSVFDPLAFPENGSGNYWTSSVIKDKGRPDMPIMTCFKDGGQRSTPVPDKKAMVRLVRGEEITAPPLFITNEDGTAIDPRTGFQWMRPFVGQSWSNGKIVGDADRMTFEAAQKIELEFSGFNDWRVPNCDELGTLVSPGGNITNGHELVFSNLESRFFLWSSTLSSIKMPYCLEMGNISEVFSTSPDQEMFVGMVRGPVTLSVAEKCI